MQGNVSQAPNHLGKYAKRLLTKGRIGYDTNWARSIKLSMGSIYSGAVVSKLKLYNWPES